MPAPGAVTSAAGRAGVQIRTAASLGEVRREQWNALAGGHPLLRHEFLHALESSGCVGGSSGGLRGGSEGTAKGTIS